MIEPWLEWRRRWLEGNRTQELPDLPGRDEEGAWLAGGIPSAGATGEAVCHLILLGQADSGAVATGCDWLEEARTPAGAWLAATAETPGDLEDTGGPRVWATANAACALLAAGRHPGERALSLLHGESDQHGRFTGGSRTTAAAAGAFWLARGPKNELAEWGLRWAREHVEEFGVLELTAALTFWGAARIPADHPSISDFCDALRAELEAAGEEMSEGTRLSALEVLEVLD